MVCVVDGHQRLPLQRELGDNVVGVILIPTGLGGINGVLEATVVEGDIPLLLPIRLLKVLQAIINLPEALRVAFSLSSMR